MSQNISENWYRHSALKTKKEMPIKRRTYTRKLKKENLIFLQRYHTLGGQLITLVHIHANYCIIYPDTERDTEREKRGSRDVLIHVQLVKT